MTHTPAQIVDAIRAAAELPGADALRPALLDGVRMIAGAVAGAADLRRRADAVQAQRRTLAPPALRADDP